MSDNLRSVIEKIIISFFIGFVLGRVISCSTIEADKLAAMQNKVLIERGCTRDNQQRSCPKTKIYDESTNSTQ